MDKHVEEVADYSMLLAQIYLLLRIALSRNLYFKTPFFFFFLLTGALGSLSVVGFIIAVRFPIPEETAWIFKFGYIMNIFGVTGSTIGKVYIAVHRYAVMRNIRMLENIWSNRLKFQLAGVLVTISCIRCVYTFFCGYSIVTKGGMNFVSYLDDACIVVDKSESSLTYFVFIIASIILTMLTSRQLYRIQKIGKHESAADLKTKRMIIDQQRKMFIIVSVCTISHLIKAIHQFSWVFVAYFHLSEFNTILQTTYVYTHYLATYSASITLVIFSPRVRMLLISRRDLDERSIMGTTVI